jgi:hypothetical protein
MITNDLTSNVRWENNHHFLDRCCSVKPLRVALKILLTLTIIAPLFIGCYEFFRQKKVKDLQEEKNTNSLIQKICKVITLIPLFILGLRELWSHYSTANLEMMPPSAFKTIGFDTLNIRELRILCLRQEVVRELNSSQIIYLTESTELDKNSLFSLMSEAQLKELANEILNFPTVRKEVILKKLNWKVLLKKLSTPQEKRSFISFLSNNELRYLIEKKDPFAREIVQCSSLRKIRDLYDVSTIFLMLTNEQANEYVSDPFVQKRLKSLFEDSRDNIRPKAELSDIFLKLNTQNREIVLKDLVNRHDILNVLLEESAFVHSLNNQEILLILDSALFKFDVERKVKFYLSLSKEQFSIQDVVFFAKFCIEISLYLFQAYLEDKNIISLKEILDCFPTDFHKAFISTCGLNPYLFSLLPKKAIEDLDFKDIKFMNVRSERKSNQILSSIQSSNSANWIDTILNVSDAQIRNLINHQLNNLTGNQLFSLFADDAYVLRYKYNDYSFIREICLVKECLQKLNVSPETSWVTIEKILNETTNEWNERKISDFYYNLLKKYLEENNLLNKGIESSNVKKAYETLGLKNGASFNDVKKTWHNFAKKNHPDRNKTSDHEIYTAKSNAYDLLKLQNDVKNAFEILGLKNGASLSDVENAWRDLKNHSDKNKNLDSTIFEAQRNAYEFLKTYLVKL